jgi:hypothetical protein
MKIQGYVYCINRSKDRDNKGIFKLAFKLNSLLLVSVHCENYLRSIIYPICTYEIYSRDGVAKGLELESR